MVFSSYLELKTIKLLNIRLLIHFELTLYVVWDRGPNPFVWIRIPSCSSTICQRDCSCPIEQSWHPCQKKLTIDVQVYFWILDSTTFVYLFIPMPTSCCCDYCSFVVSFKIGNCQSFNFVLLFHIVFAIWAPFQFHMNLRIDFLISEKKIIEILIGVALNL